MVKAALEPWKNKGANAVVRTWKRVVREKYRQGTLKRAEPADAEAERLEEALEGALQTLDGALDVLFSSLSPELRHSVLLRVFDALCWRIADLPVPPVEPIPGFASDKRNAWEDARVEALGGALEILRLFFHADGEGIPLEVLDAGEGFRGASALLAAYGMGKRELREAHAREGPSPERIAVLRRLRSRGEGEAVEEELRRWCAF
ncbi:hypothetical protein DFJ74DRAFT_702529 [Hyaloraphidium curvatum]|nr:hypothetical protein DFJ74DRAFT_702529 [Hyaloraphidium curvatum]